MPGRRAARHGPRARAADARARRRVRGGSRGEDGPRCASAAPGPRRRARRRGPDAGGSGAPLQREVAGGARPGRTGPAARPAPRNGTPRACPAAKAEARCGPLRDPPVRGAWAGCPPARGGWGCPPWRSEARGPPRSPGPRASGASATRWRRVPERPGTHAARGPAHAPRASGASASRWRPLPARPWTGAARDLPGPLPEAAANAPAAARTRPPVPRHGWTRRPRGGPHAPP